MSKSDPFSDLKRVADLHHEAMLASTILRYAQSGHATPLMIEQAIALVDKQIAYTQEINDKGWLANSMNLKAGLERALIEGVRTLRTVRPPGRETLEIEEPLAKSRLAAGHKIRRQHRCATGIVDIYDLTTDELIECKLRGTNAALGEAAGQLKRYRQSFPGSGMTIAVLSIEEDAVWLAGVLAHEGIRIIKIEKGGAE